MTRRTAAALAMLATLAVAVSACGSSGPSSSEMRATVTTKCRIAVENYLDVKLNNDAMSATFTDPVDRADGLRMSGRWNASDDAGTTIDLNCTVDGVDDYDAATIVMLEVDGVSLYD